MTNIERKRLLAIGTFMMSVALMLLVIDQYMVSGLAQNQSTHHVGERKEETSETPILKQAGPMVSSNETPWVKSGQTGNRTIMTYLRRRSYPGAPPVIPHEVDENALNKSNCQSCHEEGGYVKKFEAYAPVTPHRNDEMKQSCRQCHQPKNTDKLFRETDWKTVTPPGNERSGLSSAPPQIPHDLQYRSFCLSCHAGPAAVDSIRTDHPERSNCRQCHQPIRTPKKWSREDTKDE